MGGYSTAVANPDTDQRIMTLYNQIVVISKSRQPVIDHSRTHIESRRLCFAAVLAKIFKYLRQRQPNSVEIKTT